DTAFTNTAVDGFKFNSIVYAITIDSSNNIYIGGSFSNYAGNYNLNCLIKLNGLSGALNTLFVNKITNRIATAFGSKPVYALATNSVNYIYVGGGVFDYNDDTNAHEGVFSYFFKAYQPQSINTTLLEQGDLLVNYDPINSDWYIANGNILGDSGVEFDITNTGQVTYTSSSMPTASYTGAIKYRIKNKYRIT
ncbi:MAG: hypothetical protein WHS45_13410, partial [Anaerolinea sp.]